MNIRIHGLRSSRVLLIGAFTMVFLLILLLIFHDASKDSTIAYAITSDDIDEGKQMIVDYFQALKTSDTVILKSYVSYNLVGIKEIGACNVNGKNPSLAFLYDDDFKPDLIRIETSTKYPLDTQSIIEEMKHSYSIDIYQVLGLHVYFNYGIDHDWDFILIKETESSPWKIHLWRS